MISPKSLKSSPIPVPHIDSRTVRAYSDPNIFKSERVLRSLVSREMKQNCNYFSSLQTDLKPGMREDLCTWLLEVCEEEKCEAQVFCLAVNYLDRFLAVCPIRKSQLQLLGAVCLLVSLKVRAHKIISAQKLIEFSDYALTLEDLLEWEFLLLSKLDWDLSAVIATDYVEHILQRLLKLDLAWDPEKTRQNAETLIYMCYTHYTLSSYPPSLIAVSSILTTLRPVLETVVTRDTPSPSSSSSCSSPSSLVGKSDEPLENVIEAVEKLTLVERSLVLKCMEKLESLMHASLPPSPSPSDEDGSPLSKSAVERSASYPQLALRSLFPETEILDSQPSNLSGLSSGLS